MKKLIKIEEICSIALFLIILMILFWQIFSRKVLNAPASWSEELSRLLFVYMGILGCHLAQHYETHIRIDFILHTCRPAQPYSVMCNQNEYGGHQQLKDTVKR